MKNSLNLTQLNKFLGTHHISIYVVTIALIFAGVVFSYYQIIDQILGQPASPNEETITFDKETIEKVEQLHPSEDNQTEIDLPASRPSPFTE